MLAIDETASLRHCDAFGHPLAILDYWEDAPPCFGCARLVRELALTRRDGMTYVSDRCGQIGAVIVSRRAGVLPYAAMTSEPNGPLYNIGRRASRAEALAAVAASHDCED